MEGVKPPERSGDQPLVRGDRAETAAGLLPPAGLLLLAVASLAVVGAGCAVVGHGEGGPDALVPAILGAAILGVTGFLLLRGLPRKAAAAPAPPSRGGARPPSRAH